MPVSFQLPPGRALDLIGFTWSPMFEAVLSLPTVVEPQGTPMHLPWARRCRELPQELRDEIEYLIGPFDTASGARLLSGFVPGIFQLGLDGRSMSFDDDLAALNALDEDLLAYELSMAYGGPGTGHIYNPASIHDTTYRQNVLERAATDSRQTALIHAVFDEPAALRDRYVQMLTRYWESAFAAKWDEMLPRLEAEATDGAHALATGGPHGLVTEILPESHWDPTTSSIVVDKDWQGGCEITGKRRLNLVPSVFGWPRVLIELSAPWPLLVVFPLRDLRQPAVPRASDTEVVDGIRAFADHARLQIARLVAEAPRSTTELSELLSLSNSAISRHLKIMEGVGLLTGTRDGYYVLYQLNTDRIDTLTTALHRTLGLTTTATGTKPAIPVSVPRHET